MSVNSILNRSSGGYEELRREELEVTKCVRARKEPMFDPKGSSQSQL